MVRQYIASMAGKLRQADGFSLVELIVVAGISTIVLGSALTITALVQRSHSTQMQDTAVEQEARYALDWITGLLRAAGTNPYSITLSDCPAAGTPFQALRMDPDGDGLDDDIRIQADINPLNGALGGLLGACTEAGEDVVIAHDPAALVITRRDMLSLNAGTVAMTDGIFTQLVFTYRDVNRAITAVPDNVVYVGVSVTGRSRAMNPYTSQFTTFTLQSDVRLRAR